MSNNNVDTRLETRIGNLRSQVYSIGSSDTVSSGDMSEMEQDLRRRQQSYIRKQREYESEIEKLKEELAEHKQERSKWMQDDSGVQNLKSLHASLMKNLTLMKEKNDTVAQKEDSDLLKAFRARLVDVKVELESDRKMTDTLGREWIERNRHLERSLESSQLIIDKLEKQNTSKDDEIRRLKEQLDIVENEKEELIQKVLGLQHQVEEAKLVAESATEDLQGLKEKNEQLRKFKIQALQQQSATAFVTPPATSQIPGQVTTGPSCSERDNKYKAVIQRLKDLLDKERNNLENVRTSYSRDMEMRTDMEIWFRESLRDIRKRIMNHLDGDKLSSLSHCDIEEDLKLLTSGALDSADILQMLLAQERVLTAIMQKTIPDAQAPAPSSIEGIGATLDTMDLLAMSSGE